jgi:hypothetical protein
MEHDRLPDEYLTEDREVEFHCKEEKEHDNECLPP